VRHREALVADIAARTRQLKTRTCSSGCARPACRRRDLTVDRVLRSRRRGERHADGGAASAAARLSRRRPADPLERQRPGVRRVPPLLGEHSADVLTWLGYTLDDVRNLQSQGVVQ